MRENVEILTTISIKTAIDIQLCVLHRINKLFETLQENIEACKNLASFFVGSEGIVDNFSAVSVLT